MNSVDVFTNSFKKLLDTSCGLYTWEEIVFIEEET